MPDLAAAAARHLAALAPLAQRIDFAPGDTLFRVGEPTSGLFLVDAGEVRLTRRTPGDGVVELARVGAGGLIGELSLLDPGPRSASAIALTGGHARRFAPPLFAGAAAGGDPHAHALLGVLRREVAGRMRASLVALDDQLRLGSRLARGERDHQPPASMPLAAEDAARLLASFPGFDQFAAADWTAFAGVAQRLEAPIGARLAGEGLIIVARGAVREDRHLDGTVEQIFLHGPGALAGLLGWIDGVPPPLSLTVREDATLFTLPTLPADDAPYIARLMALASTQLVRDMRRLDRMLGRHASLRPR